MKKLFFLVIFIFAYTDVSVAQRARKNSSRSSESRRRLTYDIGASAGTYGNTSYSEVTFGVNWYFIGPIAWRNALFTRFGSRIDSVLGVDTSLRYVYDSMPEPGEVGFIFFGGPGYRIANERNSAFFVEGGAVAKLTGLSVGGGIKSLSYTNPGDNPKTENIVFIIIAGGGVF